MKRFTINRFITALSFLGIFTLSTGGYASAFQLFEQDAGTMGENHGGYAAKAEDASTAWYNPAGITRIKNQQLVFGGLAVTPSFKFNGEITVNTLGGDPLPVTAQGGAFAFVPFIHYVAPLSDCLGFGFSVVAPFGLKTSYGSSSIIRYAATLSAVTVVDISAVLAYQYNNFSFGIGPDFQRMYGEFDQVGTFLGPDGGIDGTGTNKANDNAWGYHAGILYEYSPQTRAGLSYHSQVVHHLTGKSYFEGPLAELNGGTIYTDQLKGTLTLPAYTALSVYHRLNPCWALMASATYTQWSVFKTLSFNNISGLTEDGPSTTIAVNIPEHYQNSWNLSLGSNYNVWDNLMLRAGIGFDETPVQDAYRNIQLPDTNRYILSLGGHFQATKKLGVDFSWLHVFVRSTHLNPPPQITGAQEVTQNGSVKGGADLIGAQLVWDL